MWFFVNHGGDFGLYSGVMRKPGRCGVRKQDMFLAFP